MMYGFDEALELETKALQINIPSEDRIARELDTQLWQLLQIACQHNPDDACHVFGLSSVTASVIAEASAEKINELVCGAVLSFHIKNITDLADKIELVLASGQPSQSKLIADYSPELKYWRAVQIMALRDPHLAHARTGIPTDLLILIQSADEWQLRQLAYSGSQFGFACTEKIIIDILTENRPNLLTQLRLKKVQQCLTSRGENSSCNAPPPCTTVRSSHRELIGRLMLISGFVNKVIELETGLSYKQIIKLQAQIKAEGIKMNKPKSRALKSGGGIIYNYSSKIQASLLMQLYVNIGWHDVYQNTNVNALLRAYRIYGELREEIPGMKTAKWEPLDINSAWGLTAELRRSADAGMMNHCKRCRCSYFTTASQRTFIECPFCHDKPSIEEVPEYQHISAQNSFCSQKKELHMAPTLVKKDPEKRRRRPLRPKPILKPKPIKPRSFAKLRISNH